MRGKRATIRRKKTDVERKAHGILLTPELVVPFLAGRFEAKQKCVRLLDPAAGLGSLVCAVVKNLGKKGVIEEIELVPHELSSFASCKSFTLSANGVRADSAKVIE